jgi:hypothetical protein
LFEPRQTFPAFTDRLIGLPFLVKLVVAGQRTSGFLGLQGRLASGAGGIDGLVGIGGVVFGRDLLRVVV